MLVNSKQKETSHPETLFSTIEAETLPKYLRLGYRKWANKIFMRRKTLGIWKGFTWQQVYEQVKYFGLGLASLGLEPGETVAISGENEMELFWAQYAALAMGGKVVCLYPDMTPGELQYILENSDSVYYIAEDQEQVDKALEIRDKLTLIRKIIYWDSRGMWHYRDPILMDFQRVQEEGRRLEGKNPGLFEESLERGKGDDPAVLSYTSGTTGLPKGVIMTHNNLIDYAFRILKHVPLQPFSHYLSYISPGWATEQMFGITLGLILPLTLNFPEKPETVLANIRELGAEILIFGPRQWEDLASLVRSRMFDAGPIRRLFYNIAMAIGSKKTRSRTEGERVSFIWHLLYPLADLLVLRALRDKLGLSHTHLAMSGGSAMAPETFRFFHSMGVKLRNGFGSTEAGLYTIHMGDSFDLESMGQWYTSDTKFGPPLEWKITEEGELLVRGGSGFSGYYKKPEASAEKMLDGWFRTGDAVYMKENGELIYLDRVSDLRKLSSGHHFPPQFIETRLRFSPYIKDAMTLGDDKKSFVAALININAQNVGRWAERKGLSYSTFPDLSQKEEVRELIRGEIDRVNSLLEEKSRILKFVNLAKELDPDEAELTRTRKLRRDFLETRYKDLIEAIYAAQAEVISEVPVKYRDGRTGRVRTTTYINSTKV